MTGASLLGTPIVIDDKGIRASVAGVDLAPVLETLGITITLPGRVALPGEKSGQLEDMLLNVANAYDSQVETRIAAMTSLLEPVMIVMMGGVVAFIVFSILMPILQMNTMVH